MHRKRGATRRAKSEGLRARSAYKLKELDNKYGLLKGANHVLDLGSWPGGWSLVAAKHAPVTAVDLKQQRPIEGVEFIRGDLFDESVLERLPAADVVLSDAMANTAGNAADQYQSFLLAQRTLAIALARLRPGGAFVCKIFQGPDFDSFLEMVRPHFSFSKTTKPATSRSQSKEMYVVATGFGR